MSVAWGDRLGRDAADPVRPIGVGQPVICLAPSPAPVIETAQVRFRFVPFADPEPGRHTGAEYL
ncbi:hypothetical protein [Pseudonocardia asaccharolytica]|uniref:hypothetical protein n=1 Tax=Pseudonocardia asaccharolytica TaxID=54010 RepID=UPI0011BE8B9B|nr:hypothetical protein [Pseudonocardia asaccharolytica]